MTLSDPLWDDFLKKNRVVRTNSHRIVNFKPQASLPSPVTLRGTTHASTPSPMSSLGGGMRVPQPQPPSLTPAPLDPRVLRRLSLGHYPIAARIDLHGYTQADAYDRLRYLIPLFYYKNQRMILVITGRGLHNQGVLRQSFVRWIAFAPLSPYVLSYSPCTLKDGGDGAFYVLLRRHRSYAGV